MEKGIKKLLTVMEYDIPYTSKALMEKLGLYVMVTLENYDAAKLIEDLSTCSEKRTFRIADDGYRLDTVLSSTRL